MSAAAGRNRWFLLALAAGALAGCKPDGSASLFRMLDQAKVDTWEPSPVFADGTGMRTPPPGAVPRERPAGPPELHTGLRQGVPVKDFPLPVDRALLERGRDRFDIFCAACHGLAGDGDSVVARNMQLRPPPSLGDARVRALPPGRIFQVATEGYGFMPGYATELSERDRWAVTAYVRALQLSMGTRLDELPAPVRARALQQLGDGQRGKP